MQLFKSFKDRLKRQNWHFARVMGRLQNYKRLLKKPVTRERRLLLELKREVYAHKKHIVLTELIIQKYENELNKQGIR